MGNSNPDIQIPRWKVKQVKTPTLLQMEATECGSASLGIILGYFGRFETLEYLRHECGVSRDGSNAGNILKAAKRFGLEAKGFSVELNGLKNLSLPIILFWKFNHFLVLEGTRGNKFFLNDPAQGHRTVSIEKFDESFTGIALEFSKSAAFKPGGREPSIWPSLKRRMATVKKALVFTMLCALFLVVPNLIIPSFTQIFIDNVIVRGMDNWIKPILIAMAMAVVFIAVLTFSQQYYLVRMETKLALKGTLRFIRRLLFLPVSFFSQRQPGDLANRTTLSDTVSNVLAIQLAPNLMNLIMLVFYMVVMLMYDWLLACVAVVMVLLNMLALGMVSKKKKDLSQRVLNEQNQLMGVAMGGIQLIETIKASGSETTFFARWAGYQAKNFNAGQEFARTNQYLLAVPPLLSALNSICILGIGGFRIMSGDLTMGQLVAFQFLTGIFATPVIQMVNTGSELQNTTAKINQLDDVLHSRPDFLVSDPHQSGKVPDDHPLKLVGGFSMHNVTFGYSRLASPLIENFNLNLSPGARVALVGVSGSGKTTIAKVASGLYQAWSGEVCLDGVPVNQVHRHIFTRSVSTVDQDLFLFDGTIRENLSMWDDTIPEADIIQAARDAQIYDDIMCMSDGLDSRVAERGKNFSGGQCQRLEIARALVKHPTLLILDEATSALDTQTEKAVDEGIRRRGCTCMIIAHRLSTIRDADEIIVLSNGKITQRGIHDELKKVSGVYADLLTTQ